MDKASQGAPAARNTPGPWLPDGDYIRYGERPPDAGKVGWPAIAKALTVKAKRIEERRANVALLAAAPALADELEWIRAYVAKYGSGGSRAECLPRLDAVLRLAGRVANNVSAAPAAPSNSKEQP